MVRVDISTQYNTIYISTVQHDVASIVMLDFYFRFFEMLTLYAHMLLVTPSYVVKVVPFYASRHSWWWCIACACSVDPNIQCH